MGSPLPNYDRMRRLCLTRHGTQRLECPRMDYPALPPTAATGAAVWRPGLTASSMTQEASRPGKTLVIAAGMTSRTSTQLPRTFSLGRLAD
jgi:hypothetical protein